MLKRAVKTAMVGLIVAGAAVGAASSAVVPRRNDVPRKGRVPAAIRAPANTYSKVDPATGFIAKLTIAPNIPVDAETRDLMLNKTIKCVKKITGFYGLPLPARFEIIFYDAADGPRHQVAAGVGGLKVQMGMMDVNHWIHPYVKQVLPDAPDCFVSTHEMAHAVGPFDKGILEEGYADFTLAMLNGYPDLPTCTEVGYCIDYNSEFYEFPYSLIHPTEVNGEAVYGSRHGAKYQTGDCAWRYIYSRFGRTKLRQIFDRFESDDCNYGNCITDFILPVLGERETRQFEQKFDLNRTDTRLSSENLQPIRGVGSCNEVRPAIWNRPPRPIEFPLRSRPFPDSVVPTTPHVEIQAM